MFARLYLNVEIVKTQKTDAVSELIITPATFISEMIKTSD